MLVLQTTTFKTFLTELCDEHQEEKEQFFQTFPVFIRR